MFAHTVAGIFLPREPLLCPVVCLGSLSSWKMQPRLIFDAPAEGRFLLKISGYIAPFILSLTWVSRPVPLQKTAPKHDVSTPMHTVHMVFLECNSAFFILQTR